VQARSPGIIEDFLYVLHMEPVRRHLLGSDLLQTSLGWQMKVEFGTLKNIKESVQDQCSSRGERANKGIGSSVPA
jgi:hypothetical protein